MRNEKNFLPVDETFVMINLFPFDRFVVFRIVKNV